ncbi:MAG: bifunctional DNA-formamidopyrimidine glycosylase/DNA-(apurinic or apyrimidinic site) lyase [Polyangiaceae bacterium]
MPELPEVEHAATCLRAWLVGRTLDRVRAPASRVLRGASPITLARKLRGRRLRAVDRRSKYLLLRFDGDVGLLAHLGMTGKWVLRARGETPPPHTRLTLETGARAVHYVDPRMFGRLALHAAGELDALPEIRVIGPDPHREKVGGALLAARLGKTRRAIKVALLDPRVIAGIGNILATEALWRARIHPARPATSLGSAELAALARAVRASIRLQMGTLEAASDATYLSEDASHNPFLAYGRVGEPCSRCATPFLTMVLGGRGSAFCPTCQVAPRTSRTARATRGRASVRGPGSLP